MTQNHNHAQIYTDLIIAFSRGNPGDCDPCARWALHEFARLTVLNYVDQGHEYAAVRNYIRRQFTAIGRRVFARTIFTTAEFDDVVDAIHKQVAETRQKLDGVKTLGRVCETFTPGDIGECPSDVQLQRDLEHSLV